MGIQQSDLSRKFYGASSPGVPISAIYMSNHTAVTCTAQRECRFVQLLASFHRSLAHDFLADSLKLAGNSLSVLDHEI